MQYERGKNDVAHFLFQVVRSAAPLLADTCGRNQPHVANRVLLAHRPADRNRSAGFHRSTLRRTVARESRQFFTGNRNDEFISKSAGVVRLNPCRFVDISDSCI